MTWALLALTAACPLAIGGAYPVTALVVAPLALGLLAAVLLPRPTAPLPLIATVPLVAALACAFQLVPWPRPLLGVLSPEARAIVDFTVVPLGLSTWRPISLDPPATARMIAFFLSVAACAWVAYLASRGSRTFRAQVPRFVAGLGAALVLGGLGHLLLGVDALFGLYHFQDAQPPYLTPFGNPNHLASFLTLSGTLALGVALEANARFERLRWALVWGVCGAGVVWSNSRTGMAVFGLTQLAVLVLTLRSPASRPNRVGVMQLGAVVLAGLAAAPFVFWERLSDRFGDTQSAFLKVQQWPNVLTAIGDYWRFGMGRGAFELGFGHYYAGHHGKTFTHPEDLALQWVVELGVPLGMLVFALGGRAAWQAFRHRSGSALETAALVGAAGVVLHDLFDFGLEQVGVAVPLAVVVGAALGPLEGIPVRLVATRRLSLALAGLLGVSLLLGRSFARDVESSLAAVVAGPAPMVEVERAALNAIDHHPADGLLYAQAAHAWVHRGDGDPREALAFANRALLLSPRLSSSHQLAAEALVRLGKTGQAIGEYRLALETARDPAALELEALQVARNAAEAWRLAGGSVPVALQLAAVAASLRGLPFAAQMLELAFDDTAQGPERDHAFQEAMRLQLAAGDLEAASRLLHRAPAHSPAVEMARANLLEAQGHAPEALEVLRNASTAFPQHFPLARQLIARLVTGKQYDEARGVVRRVSPAVVATDERVELLLVEGQVLDEGGLVEQALVPLRSAVRLAPSVRTHQVLASVLEHLGRFEEAEAEVRTAARLEGGTSTAYGDWLSRLAQKRAAARQPRPQ